MAVVMFCALGIFLLYEIIKHNIKYIFKNNKMINFMFLISIISLLFILKCPGNQERKLEETEKWFPEQENLNLIEKMELVLTTTVGKLVLETNNMFFVFTAIIFIYVCVKEKNIALKFISSILLLISCAYTFFLNYILLLIPSFEAIL